jgi:hypothetical protein
VSGAPSRSDTVTPTPHDGRLGLRVAAAAALPAEADLRTWFADVARLGRESSGRCADVCNGSPWRATGFSDWRPASPIGGPLLRSDRVATGKVWWSVWWSKRFRAHVATLTEGILKPLTRAFAAEEVGFEPTDPCRSHDFQSCRFGRSRTPPTGLSPLSLHLLALSRAVAGFCATGDRESGQGRKAAALSGFACVPQGTWLLRTTAPEPWRASLPTQPGPVLDVAGPVPDNAGRRVRTAVARGR